MSEEKTNLFILDKKEVALLFIFMIVISVISFTVGFRIGKGIAFQKAGLTASDKQVVEMKSIQEEDAQKALDLMSKQGTTNPNLTQDSFQHLKKEFDQVSGRPATTDGASSPAPTPAESKGDADFQLPKSAEKVEAKADDVKVVKEESEKKNYVGKYTIQLGSHPTLQEAKEFADGFTIRGYNPIINEVKIDGKGTWYRVSLGTFNTVAEAKGYVQKEDSLFQGQDYVITELK